MKAAGIVLAILLNALLCSAQTNPPPGPAEEEVRDESDPTRSVFFSVRNEYFNLNDEAWTNALILRSDRVFLRKRRRLRRNPESARVRTEPARRGRPAQRELSR